MFFSPTQNKEQLFICHVKVGLCVFFFFFDISFLIQINENRYFSFLFNRNLEIDQRYI